ncbi:MAG: GGDEF domain-containing protein, partial [Hyphomicrobiales bacterium]
MPHPKADFRDTFKRFFTSLIASYRYPPTGSIRMRIFPDAATRDAVILLTFGLVSFGLLQHIDAHEMLDEFFRSNEAWQADDFVLGLLTTGILGFVYAWRRLADLKREAVQRNKAEGYAEWLAYHDPLTRLPNRHFLEARLADGDWGLSSVGSVIAIDLDGFKKVNDLVGHHGGDELLVAIGRRLSESFPVDVAIRLGGDEFLLVTPRTGNS